MAEIAPLENNRFCHLARPITFYRTRDICIEPGWGKKNTSAFVNGRHTVGVKAGDRFLRSRVKISKRTGRVSPRKSRSLFLIGRDAP